MQHRNRPQEGRAPGVSLVLTASVLLAGGRPAAATPLLPESAAEMAERVVAAGASHTEPRALLRELAPFGAGGVTALLHRSDGDDPPGTRRAVRDALRGLPAAALEWLADPAHQSAERTAVGAAALAAVRELGSAADLEHAIFCAAASVEGTPTRSHTERLERALEAVLRRDRKGFTTLGRVYGSTPPDLRIAVVRATGNTLSSDGLELLVELLGSSELDLPILSQISRTAAALGPLGQERASLAVRTYLRSSQAELRRESALAVARLNDCEAVPDLIALLEDEARGVRDNALWALQQLTGMGRTADPGVWRRWYDAEVEWWEREAPDLLTRLDRIELLADAEIVASINELGRHRLFREDLARRLFGALDHRDPRVVRLACVALQQFEARSAVPQLIELLEHRDRTVQQQAWTALKAITGRNLPLRRGAWLQGLS